MGRRNSQVTINVEIDVNLLSLADSPEMAQQF